MLNEVLLFRPHGRPRPDLLLDECIPGGLGQVLDIRMLPDNRQSLPFDLVSLPLLNLLSLKHLHPFLLLLPLSPLL